MPRGSLEGKVVVIVGASSGLGLSGLRACVAAGGKVVAVCPAHEASLADAKGVRLHVGDARHPETARGAIRRAIDDLGGFDALYHVAGGSGRTFGDGPLHALSDTGWDETLRLNLTSAFYSARAATESFLERKALGSVLLMGSVLGTSPSPGFFDTHAYAAAKAAILGLVTTAAASYAPAGIRFNAVMPGLTETPMSHRATSDPRILAFVRSKQPLEGGRAGTTADLDGAVVFFLSDDSRFVTGQALAVDGGWSVSDGGPRSHGTGA
jgi:NAD(P)-dependent dehydrogenase (short-subunit alcohol dehydrogenase family)